jgi:hypothetical protein
MVKTCFKCGKEASIESFYRHSRMADGHLGKCKECTKADARAHRARRLAYYRAYDRMRSMTPKRVEARAAYQLTPSGKASMAKAKINWIARNPDKRRAHYTLNGAVRDGCVQKMPCADCGSDFSQAHHEDYSKPLEVTWLCAKCHAGLHKSRRALASDLLAGT